MITVSLQGGIAMIEKWKKWVLKMNLKRAALIFDTHYCHDRKVEKMGVKNES